MSTKAGSIELKGDVWICGCCHSQASVPPLINHKKGCVWGGEHLTSYEWGCAMVASGAFSGPPDYRKHSPEMLMSLAEHANPNLCRRGVKMNKPRNLRKVE